MSNEDAGNHLYRSAKLKLLKHGNSVKYVSSSTSSSNSKPSGTGSICGSFNANSNGHLLQSSTQAPPPDIVQACNTKKRKADEDLDEHCVNLEESTTTIIRGSGGGCGPGQQIHLPSKSFVGGLRNACPPLPVAATVVQQSNKCHPNEISSTIAAAATSTTATGLGHNGTTTIIQSTTTANTTNTNNNNLITSSTPANEGDYRIIVGEKFNSLSTRYEVLAFLGRGTFGQVVKCRCNTSNRLVAIKILKNHPSYHRQGSVEISILQTLSREDTEAFNIVRAIECFQHKNHMCLVFELLEQNLYDYLKLHKFKPLDLCEIRPITQQVLVALLKLKQLGIIHADLKPENIMLVNHTMQENWNRFRVKVIDFGSACPTSKVVANSYLQSRYYRAPEVLLGLPFNEAIDMWSLGCVIAELYLGWPLYPGASEFDQMRYIVETQGMPSPAQLMYATKVSRYFVLDSNGHYRLKRAEEYFQETGLRYKEVRKYKFHNLTSIEDAHVVDINYTNNVLQMGISVMGDPREYDLHVDARDRREFAQLLSEMLALNKNDRITPEVALSHPFITMSHMLPLIAFSKRAKESLVMMQVCQESITCHPRSPLSPNGVVNIGSGGRHGNFVSSTAMGGGGGGNRMIHCPPPFSLVLDQMPWLVPPPPPPMAQLQPPTVTVPDPTDASLAANMLWNATLMQQQQQQQQHQQQPRGPYPPPSVPTAPFFMPPLPSTAAGNGMFGWPNATAAVAAAAGGGAIGGSAYDQFLRACYTLASTSNTPTHAHPLLAAAAPPPPLQQPQPSSLSTVKDNPFLSSGHFNSLLTGNCAQGFMEDCLNADHNSLNALLNSSTHQQHQQQQQQNHSHIQRQGCLPLSSSFEPSSLLPMDMATANGIMGIGHIHHQAPPLHPPPHAWPNWSVSSSATDLRHVFHQYVQQQGRPLPRGGLGQTFMNATGSIASPNLSTAMSVAGLLSQDGNGTIAAAAAAAAYQSSRQVNDIVDQCSRNGGGGGGGAAGGRGLELSTSELSSGNNKTSVGLDSNSMFLRHHPIMDSPQKMKDKKSVPVVRVQPIVKMDSLNHFSSSNGGSGIVDDVRNFGIPNAIPVSAHGHAHPHPPWMTVAAAAAAAASSASVGNSNSNLVKATNDAFNKLAYHHLSSMANAAAAAGGVGPTGGRLQLPATNHFFHTVPVAETQAFY